MAYDDVDILQMLQELENTRDELEAMHEAEKSLRWENRRWLKHPYNEGRSYGEGFYNTTFQDLKRFPDKFKILTRMSPDAFRYLLRLVENHIKPAHNTPDAIPAEQRLAITLIYLAHGCQFSVLALDNKIAPSTLYKIIPETCSGIYLALSPQYLKFPATPTWRNIGKGFGDKWQLPGCISAIDGKHMKMKAPDKSGSLFFNYKKGFSMILMAAANHNCEFTWVDFGAYGGESDGGVFSRSEFGQDFEQGESNIPQESIILPGTNTTIPHYFVGDDAFKLQRNLLKPFKGNNLTEEQKIFNYRLSRGRRCVESAFGILVMRWRIFEKALGVRPFQMYRLVMAALCLHNFLSSLGETDEKIEEFKKRQEERVEDEENTGGDVEPNENLQGNDVRKILMDYFNSPAGSVPWQYERVRKGKLNVTSNLQHD